MTVYVSFNLRSAEQKKASFHLHLLPVCPRGTGGRCCHSQQWGKLIYDYAFKLISLLLLSLETSFLFLLVIFLN